LIVLIDADCIDPQLLFWFGFSSLVESKLVQSCEQILGNWKRLTIEVYAR
jgi:hypothetical protein